LAIGQYRSGLKRFAEYGTGVTCFLLGRCG